MDRTKGKKKKRGKKPQIAHLLKLHYLDFKTTLINILKQR